MNESARHRSRPSDACRYVALGEGFTEGVGDDDRRLPNGVRGWADRIAEGLAAAAPGWEYANLALRGSRFGGVEAEQMPAALELKPTLASLSVGARDILVPPADLEQLFERYDAVVGMLAQTGATVMLFTLVSSSVLAGGDDRAFRYDETVRRIGRDRGAVVIDPWADASFRAARLWLPGGARLSRAGHAQLARHILDVLGVAPADRAVEHAGGPGSPTRTVNRMARVLVRLAGFPHRAPLAAPEPQHREPRWPVPVVVPALGGLHEAMRTRRNSGTPAAHDTSGRGHLVR